MSMLLFPETKEDPWFLLDLLWWWVFVVFKAHQQQSASPVSFFFTSCFWVFSVGFFVVVVQHLWNHSGNNGGR